MQRESFFHFENSIADVILPRLKVKYREQLCFSKMKMEYSDFTKFVKRNDEFIPLFAVKSTEPNDIIIDMRAFINIGIAEILGVHQQIPVAMMYRDWLESSQVFKVVEEAFDLANLVTDVQSFEDSNYLITCAGAKSSYVSGIFQTVKDIVSDLTIISLVDKSLYVQAIIDAIRYAYAYCAAFISSKEGMGVMYNGETPTLNKTGRIPGRAFEFGAVKYNTPTTGKERFITDCRGIGIFSLLLLTYYLFDMFGEKLSDKTLFLNSIHSNFTELANKNLNSCIGNDMISKTLNGKEMRIKENIDSMIFDLSGTASIDQVNYEIDDDQTISRQMYEDRILYKHATNTMYDDSDFGSRQFSSHYAGLNDYLGAIMRFMVFSKSIAILDTDAMLKTLNEQDDEIERLQQGLSDEKRNGEEVKRLNELHKKDCESYENKIKELERIIASKNNIINDFGEQVCNLNQELMSYYTDELEESNISASGNVSIEDMITYLNDFKLCLVGGRMELPGKLESMGLHNVIQIDHRRAVSSTPEACDFYCINTAFVSHKLVRNVQSRYPSLVNRMFYYNGTNVENLIKSAYSFVKQWSNESNRDR